MLTQIYIEALLVDEELADKVWEAWHACETNDLGAGWLWLWIAVAGDLAGQYPFSCLVPPGVTKSQKLETTLTRVT